MAEETTGRRYVDYVVLEVTDGFSCVANGRPTRAPGGGGSRRRAETASPTRWRR